MNLRNETRIATWNVQTLLRAGYPELLSHELKKYDITLAGLCETRWPSSGECVYSDHCFLWSGPQDGSGHHGVALAVPRNLRNSLVKWKPVNDRLLSARFLHRHGKLTVIVAYAPTERADEDTKDSFYEQLEQEINDAPIHDITIVLTDANASLASPLIDDGLQTVTGNVFVDPTTNDNGQRLLHLCRSTNLCIADTWFPRKRIHHWTWYSNDGSTRKAIDHVLISRRWRSFVTNCRVYRGAQLANTDHRLLVAHLKLRLKTNPADRYKTFDSTRLSDPQCRNLYRCSINNRFNTLSGENYNDWDKFKVEVTKAAEVSIGRIRPAPRKPWISQRTLEIVEARKSARLNGNAQEYRRLNQERNISVKRDKEHWSEQATRLESAAQRNQHLEVYKILRESKAGPKRKVTLVKDSSGRTLNTEDECINRWKEHFQQLLNHPPTTEDPELSVEAISPTIYNVECSIAPVTSSEVREAIKKLKNGKAAGVCSITTEMIKEGGEVMIQWLTNVINHVWITERLPSDWTRGVILPFWKRKGDQLLCSNHRGITLLSIPGKLYTRILLTRALPALRSRRRPQQAGFMPNRSTTDHISAIRLTIEKFREFRKQRHLYIGFIDLKAAFDTVDHNALWKILKTLGVPQKIVNAFRNLYSDAESCVRVNGRSSSWFTINSGVRQGCVAAPDLFNCVIDYLMTRVCSKVPGVWLDNFNLTDAEYADDTALFANNYDILRDCLVTFKEEAAKLGLKVNWKKTELMHIGEGPTPAPMVIDDEVVKFVTKFTYLGSTVTSNGDLLPEINRRRGLAAAVMASLQRPLWNQRSVSRNTKLRIYNAAVLSVLLYGSETWAMNKKLTARLDGFDSKALRRIEGIQWWQHISNVDLRERTRQP